MLTLLTFVELLQAANTGRPRRLRPERTTPPRATTACDKHTCRCSPAARMQQGATYQESQHTCRQTGRQTGPAPPQRLGLGAARGCLLRTAEAPEGCEGTCAMQAWQQAGGMIHNCSSPDKRYPLPTLPPELLLHPSTLFCQPANTHTAHPHSTQHVLWYEVEH